jgi:hypothetical protein
MMPVPEKLAPTGTARAFRESSQGSFYGPHSRIEFGIGQPFLINAR